MMQQSIRKTWVERCETRDINEGKEVKTNQLVDNMGQGQGQDNPLRRIKKMMRDDKNYEGWRVTTRDKGVDEEDACYVSIWANSMIGMRKLSGCQCRNMWQLTGKESLASTWPMRIFTPLRPCRTTLHIIITQQSNSEEEYETEDDTTISGYYDSGWWWMMMTTIMMRWGSSTMDDGQQYTNDEKLQPSVMLETIV